MHFKEEKLLNIKYHSLKVSHSQLLMLPTLGSKTFSWSQIAICSLKMCAAMLNARLHAFVKPSRESSMKLARGKMFLGKASNFKQASCWLICL